MGGPPPSHLSCLRLTFGTHFDDDFGFISLSLPAGETGRVARQRDLAAFLLVRVFLVSPGHCRVPMAVPSVTAVFRGRRLLLPAPAGVRVSVSGVTPHVPELSSPIARSPFTTHCFLV